MVEPVPGQPSSEPNPSGILRGIFRGVFDPAARSSEAVVLAVSSGKGGTGKSFVATSLAVMLSDRGHATTLVDCDYGLGSCHLLLGLSPAWTLQHVVSGQLPVEQVVARTIYGPWLVPGGSGISAMAELRGAELAALALSLGRLAVEQDVLVFDTAAGISPQCVLTALVADLVLIVTNPEIAALTDAYALIKCLAAHRDPPPIAVIVNRVLASGEGLVVFEKLAAVTRRFSDREIHYLGEIPDEPAVTRRRLGQPPLVASHPECEATRAIRRILERAQDLAGGLRRRAAGAGLAQRFHSRLGAGS